MSRRAAAVAAPLAALALGGCGVEGSAGKPALTVSAAASLKQPFTAYGHRFDGADVRFSFAGSDELAAQIEQGVDPDVFASADTKLPDRLYQQGLVERPTVFAANRLVLAVPAGGSKVASLADVEKPGVKVAIGAESVPIGSYTRTVLDKLPAREREAILAHVRSEEPDVAGIVGKLTQRAVDAGFVYISDVRGAGGKLEAIELPGRLQPSVAYAAAVVRGSRRREQARAFIDGLVAGAGARALRSAGFEPPRSG